MATLHFILDDGLDFGKGEDAEKQYDVEMREIGPRDVLDAQIAAENVKIINGRAYAYTSDAVMGIELLRRQILRVGELQGPLEIKQLLSLSSRDFALVQLKGEELDALMLPSTDPKAAMEAAESRGRDESASEANS